MAGTPLQLVMVALSARQWAFSGESDIVNNAIAGAKASGLELNDILHLHPFCCRLSPHRTRTLRLATLTSLPLLCPGWAAHSQDTPGGVAVYTGVFLFSLYPLWLMYKML